MILSRKTLPDVGDRWMAATHVEVAVAKLLTHPTADGLGRHPAATDRKLRLVACACLRMHWRLLDADARRCLEAIEAIADDPRSVPKGAYADLDGVSHSQGRYAEIAGGRDRSSPLSFDLRSRWNATDAVACLAGELHFGWPIQAAWMMEAVRRAAFLASGVEPTDDADAPDVETACMALARDVVPSTAWHRESVVRKAWRTREVASLARSVRDERLADGRLDGDRLGVLSDCLEECGCPPSHCLLDHLRSPGTHALGCWAVDWCLDRR